jgi:hypothetical protein
LRQTTQRVPITIITDKTISTVRKTRAIPLTWENEKKGNNLLSMGSQATGASCLRERTVFFLFFINIIVSQGKKIDNNTNEDR